MIPPDVRKWDIRFLDLASEVSEWSKDVTQVGFVIVGPEREIRSTGYNGFPRGVVDNVAARHERPAKYAWTEHAERNAIFNAARMGTRTDGCTGYLHFPTSGPPCVDCARALIQSGIVRVVSRGSTDPLDWREDWRESMLVSTRMFAESGVIWEAIKIS